jgi:folate-dependent phosphoribosylglycinamide formyltransferase PurN
MRLLTPLTYHIFCELFQLQLEVQKQQALQLEKAKETEKLKNAIGHLVQVGYEHGRLIAEANIIAKETHDEDKVQELIQEAEHLKLNAYIEVQLYDLVSLSFLK